LEQQLKEKDNRKSQARNPLVLMNLSCHRAKRCAESQNGRDSY
jgi:hypothetical protein